MSTAVTIASPVVGDPADRRARRRFASSKRLVFIIPAILFLAAFSLFPLLQLVRMSFSSVSAATLNQAWVFNGFDNFRANFDSGDLNTAFVRTLIFVVAVTVVGLVGGFAAAVALRTTARTTSILLALMIFVWALPPVVNGSVWKFLLSDTGLINTLLTGLNLIDTPVPFLYDQYWALASVAFVNSWAVIPFNALVFRAAMLTISHEVFEAAQLDGARRGQEIRYILLPAVQPTTLVLTVLTVVYAFRSFDYIYVMTYGGPGSATNTLPFLGYLQAFIRFDYGRGASTAVITVALVLVLAAVYARSIRREEAE